VKESHKGVTSADGYIHWGFVPPGIPPSQVKEEVRELDRLSNQTHCFSEKILEARCPG